MTELCGCPGNTILYGTTQCPAPATQEDFLCDWCRALDCPTVTRDNEAERVAQAVADGVAQPLAELFAQWTPF